MADLLAMGNGIGTRLPLTAWAFDRVPIPVSGEAPTRIASIRD
jgi:hypothetical protein